MHTLYNRLREAINPSSSFNITLNLDTNQVRGFLFKARASLVWPRVLGGQPGSELVQFPLTQVGNSSFRDVILNNPSQQALYFHLVPLSAYPNGARVANMLPTRSKESKETALNYSNAVNSQGEKVREGYYMFVMFKYYN